MPFNGVNPVTVGLATQKPHYDQVFDNTVDLDSRLNEEHDSSDGSHTHITMSEYLNIKVTAAAGNVTLGDTDMLLNMNDGGSDRTVTLPSAASAGSGRIYKVKKVNNSSAKITVQVSGGGTIDGQTTFTIASFGMCVEFISDGSEWKVTAEHHIHVGFRATRSSTQSITTNTDTTIDFSAETYDTHNLFDTGTDTATIREPGVYTLCFQVAFAADSNGRRKAWIELNGTTVIAQTEHPGTSNNDLYLTVVTQINLAAGDTLKARVRSSGATVNVVADTAIFSATYLGKQAYGM